MIKSCSWKTRYFEVKFKTSQPAFTCSKPTLKTAEAMCENFSKSRTKTSKRHHDVVLLLSVNIIHTLFWCFYFRLWTNKWLLGNFEMFFFQPWIETFSKIIWYLHAGINQDWFHKYYRFEIKHFQFAFNLNILKNQWIFAGMISSCITIQTVGIYVIYLVIKVLYLFWRS